MKSEESSKFNLGVAKKWEYRTIQGYCVMRWFGRMHNTEYEKKRKKINKNQIKMSEKEIED